MRDYHKPYFWYLVITSTGIWLTHTGIASANFSAILNHLAFFTMAFFALNVKPLREAASQLTQLGTAAFALLFGGLVLVQFFHAGDMRFHRESLEIIVLVAIMIDRKQWHPMARAIAYYSCVLVAGSLLLLLCDGIIAMPRLWLQGRMIGVFSHPNQSASTLAMTLPFVLITDTFSNRNKFLVTAGVVLLIALAKSRTAAAMAFLIIAIATVRPWTQPWRPNRTAMAVGIGGLLMLLPFGDAVIEFLTRGQDHRSLTSFTGRTALWAQALVQIQNNLWTGVGSQAAYAAIWSRFGRHYWETTGGVHNFYLAQALTYGIPFALLVTSILFVAIVVHLRRLRRGPVGDDVRLGRAVTLMIIPGTLLFSVTEAGAAYPIYLSGQLFWLILAQAFVSEPAPAAAETQGLDRGDEFQRVG